MLMAQETLTLQDGTLVQVADFEMGFTLDGKAAVDAADDGTLHIEGYASTFDMDRQDEAFEPGAFQKSLDTYLNTNPVILYHHKYDTAMGTITEAKLDGKGLWVKGEVPKPPENSPVAGYYQQVKDKVLRGFSVGGKFYRRMTEKGPRIFKCDLREISITPMPVNAGGLFALAGKAYDNMDTMDSPELDTTDLEARLNNIQAMLEGKGSGHPDGPAIAALIYHLQAIHTLATNTKQDAESDDTQKEASKLADHVATHLTALHKLAAKHGPLPNTYGQSYL
jgi:HK97 family phage prohead protease